MESEEQLGPKDYLNQRQFKLFEEVNEETLPESRRHDLIQEYINDVSNQVETVLCPEVTDGELVRSFCPKLRPKYLFRACLVQHRRRQK